MNINNFNENKLENMSLIMGGQAESANFTAAELATVQVVEASEASNKPMFGKTEYYCPDASGRPTIRRTDAIAFWVTIKINPC
jgi:hypothetical protein